MRFGGTGNASLKEILTGLVPWPRLHYGYGSIAPVQSEEHAQQDSKSVQELATEAFDDSNALLSVSAKKGGKWAGCNLIYQGAVEVPELTNATHHIFDPSIRPRDRSYHFGDFVSRPIAVGLHGRSAHARKDGTSLSILDKTRRSAIMLTTNSCMTAAFMKVKDRARKMFERRAFVHSYVNTNLYED